MYILAEFPTGYALFQKKKEIDEALDMSYVSLVSFLAFESASHSLENMNDVSEGICNSYLKSFIELNMPKKEILGIVDKSLASSIKQQFPKMDCVTNETVQDYYRLIKTFGAKLLSHDVDKAQLGLGHAYSRAKVKFNVNRVDNMIIQAIALLDQMDKDINLFSMRVREWYGWHFPELAKIVSDNALYARLVLVIGDKSTLSELNMGEDNEELDPAVAQSVVHAARSSMGTDISEVDLSHIKSFAERVVSLSDYRKNLFNYLVSKMDSVAPNLSALIGHVVGARLISHAGSLTNLCKYPASTVQILGAEKALFRALKTKGNTPKYGLIFHSSFISKANQKNKGRISRFLANKCSIASRIDAFLDTPTSVYGSEMKNQVEERLQFYQEGTVPRKNADVMKNAQEKIEKISSKRKAEDDADAMDVDVPEKSSPKKKKAKKEKSSKKETEKVDDAVLEKKTEKTEKDSSDKRKKKKKEKKKSE